MVSSRAVTSPGSSEPSAPSELDFRGARRLTGREEWFWYLAAAVTYIVCGIWQKFLLNWFVGPLWLVAFVVIGPAVWDRVRQRGGRAGDER